MNSEEVLVWTSTPVTQRSDRYGRAPGLCRRADTPEAHPPGRLHGASNAVTDPARREEVVHQATTTSSPSVEGHSVEVSVPPSVTRRAPATLERPGRRARGSSEETVRRSHARDPVRQRPGTTSGAERGIARWAAQQVRCGETVLLDMGSTVAALARQLRPARDLTVATASLPVLQELSWAGSIHVECLGGTLRSVSNGFVGPLAEAALERMTFDRAFLGADGVTAEDGICAVDLQQTRFKELVAHRADRTYVLVPAAALGRRPFHAWAPLPPGWTLVTDDSADSASLAPFRARDADVIVVDAEGIATVET